MMQDYFKVLFSDADALSVGMVIGRIVLIAVLATMYFMFFFYAKKRNLQLYTYITVGVIVLLFVLSFFVRISELRFYVFFSMLILTIVALMLFKQDINRSLFRMSLGRSLFKDGAAAHYGREELTHSAEEIVKACLRLSKTDTGALIIIADHMSDTILDSGIKVNSEITAELLETLFSCIWTGGIFNNI